MQAAIENWRQQKRQDYSFDIQVRAGINTGPVIAGKVGNDLHMEYTVIGETVNLAHHLQLIAEPGTVLVSAETYHRTRSLVDFKILPPLALKWLTQPVEAFQALKLRSGADQISGLSGLRRTMMIGRAPDLARLQQALAAVQQQPQSRWVLLTGEAGLGKSRLVAEFCRSVKTTDIQVYQGSCLTYVRTTPLWVVAQLLRDMLNLAENESEEVQQKSLQATLEQLGLAQAEIQPYLTHVLGLNQAEARPEKRLEQLDPDMLQRQTHAALRQLIVAVARRAPTVLIFEDLHWVDPASKDFLKYLIQTTDQVSLLLILVSRETGIGDGIRSLPAAMRNERLIELSLQELSEEEGKLLADQLIPQTDVEARALKRQIVARAGGNPFYVEEIIRMLVDQGGVVRTDVDGAWQMTPQAEELLKTVPGTIRGLILARFDRLPESLRGLLQKASVLGTSFPVSLLQTVTQTSLETLAAQLNQLEVRQFLISTLFRSQPGYAFEHALLQETIYRTLLKRDRRKIHGQIGETIETSDLWLPEEQAEVLAYHFSESSQPARAVPYLVRAAENSTRRCAYETAVGHYRKAQELLSEQPESDQLIQIRLGLAHSLKHVGQFAAASQVLLEALNQLQAGNDAGAWPQQSRLAECLGELADVRQREGNYKEAIHYIETGLQVLDKAGQQEQVLQRSALLERLAWIYFRQGKLEEASRLAQAAIEHLEPANTDKIILLAKLYNILGGVYWQQGAREEAIHHVKRSLKLHETVGYFWGQATAYGNLGILYDALGEWAKADECHEQAYAIQQNIGDIQGQSRSFDNLGLLHMVMGKHDLARRELEDSLAIRQRLGDIWGIAQSHVNLAHLDIIQSRPEEAATHAQTALTLSDTIGSAEIQVPAHWCLALVYGEQGQVEAGLNSARRALEIAQAAGFMEGETDARRALGMLYARAGQHAQAESLLRESNELAQKQNAQYRQGLAMYELGRLYQHLIQVDQSASAGWQEKAMEAYEGALRLFESLGSAYDLKLAQTALAQIRVG
jgi:predicted ATPase